MGERTRVSGAGGRALHLPDHGARHWPSPARAGESHPAARASADRDESITWGSMAPDAERRAEKSTEREAPDQGLCLLWGRSGRASWRK